MDAHTLGFPMIHPVELPSQLQTLVDSSPQRTHQLALSSSLLQLPIRTAGLSSPCWRRYAATYFAFGHFQDTHNYNSILHLSSKLTSQLRTPRESSSVCRLIPGCRTYCCNRPRSDFRAHSTGNGYASLEALVQSKPDHSNEKLSGHRTSSGKSTRDRIEELIERAIFDCRFFTLMAIVGSLAGSLVCFCRGCTFVVESFIEYIRASMHGFDSGQVVFLLVEAVDTFLVGTVMLIFGMGLYELFVNNIGSSRKDSSNSSRRNILGSNLFGLFRLQERPLWLEIRSLDELKTKLGHVIVMILLVGMFEKSKKVPVTSCIDLLFFSTSILMSSGCLYLLSKLNSPK